MSPALYVTFNYKAATSNTGSYPKVLFTRVPEGANDIYIPRKWFQCGFGAVHNVIFQASKSDLFLILNSDVASLAGELAGGSRRSFREGRRLIGVAKAPRDCAKTLWYSH